MAKSQHVAGSDLELVRHTSLATRHSSVSASMCHASSKVEAHVNNRWETNARSKAESGKGSSGRPARTYRPGSAV